MQSVPAPSPSGADLFLGSSLFCVGSCAGNRNPIPQWLFLSVPFCSDWLLKARCGDYLKIILFPNADDERNSDQAIRPI